MKKIIFMLVIVLTILGFGSRFVYARSNEVTYVQRGMMGVDHLCHVDNNKRQYEWYYLHLNQEHQDLLELMFAEELATHNLKDLTSLEQKELMREIKERLIEYIIDEDLIEYGRP